MVLQARQYGDRDDEKPAPANDTAAAPVGAEGQEQRGRQRLLDVLYAGRMASAWPEIERHREAIARLRRRLVERREHLHFVPDHRSGAAPDLGTAAARWFQVSANRVCAEFTAAREMMAQWRQRVRARNELRMLSNGDLRDIRWTRAEVEAECRKPFWRA